MKKSIIVVVVWLFSIHTGNSQTSTDFAFNRYSVTVKRNLNESNTFNLYRGQISVEETENANAILGEVITNDTILRFIPLVPLGLHQDYTVIYNNHITHFSLDLPKSYELQTITDIYPSSKKLPSNVLKWYIKFANPINETNVYNHIRILNQDGDTLSRTFLNIENALVNTDGRLLTLWIEPGRQKRGLIPNQQLGSVFQPGKSYKLIVLKTLKDKQGVSMSNDFIHSFQITEDDRKKPDIKLWEIVSPETSTNDLIMHSNEPLDYGSVLGSIIILDADNKEVFGNWKFTNNEKTLIFKPTDIWSKGKYRIFFNTRIEDLAGNNLKQLFDNKIDDKDHLVHKNTEYILEFNIH